MPSSNRPHLVSSYELLARPRSQTDWFVKHLLGIGVTIIAGAPKSGKSWLALQLATCLAAGRPFLDHPCWPASVDYYAFEDSEDRTQQRISILIDRMRSVRAGEKPLTLKDLSFGFERPAATLETIPQHGPALVIVDTLAACSPMGGTYKTDYDVIAALADEARRRHVGIVLVHHTKKGSTQSTIERVLGTTGITAAADAVWVLSRPKAHETATLFVTGRDIQHDEIRLRFDQGYWQHTRADDEPGQEGLVTRKSQQAEELLLDLLSDGPVALGVLRQEAEAAGISLRTLEAAKARLGVAHFQRPTLGVRGPGQSWWHLTNIATVNGPQPEWPANASPVGQD